MIKLREIETGTDELARREYAELKNCKLNLGNQVNFFVYESFFRHFCYNKSVEYGHNLRANYDSLYLGVKTLYGGIPNEPLTRLLYNYFGKGYLNHLITLSEFVVFVHEL